jgi:hypothetical protein
MNKKTKMLLGIALVGVAGYMLYKQKPKPAFSGGVLAGRTRFNNFASAARVVDGRMSGTSKEKFSVSK